MRHFWARLGKGRLYQAPVEMGLLSQPLREDELNPVAFPF
jgi:ribosomal protein S12 methylthiotransferase accessory factor